MRNDDYAHTSAHDFYLGFTRAITGLEMNFVGKKELFVFLWVILNTWEENRWIDLEE
jgi:hypothetical protein